MYSKAKKARRRREANAARRRNIQRRDRIRRERAEARTPRSTLGIDPFAPVVLPESIQPTVNAFEIASTYGGVSRYNEQWKPENLRAYVRYFDKVCQNIDPSWKDHRWPENTTLFDMLSVMNTKIKAAYQTSDDQFLVFDSEKYGGMHRFYLVQTRAESGLACFAYMSNFCKVRKKDRRLYEIVLCVLGKATQQFILPDWMDSFYEVRDWIETMIEEEEDITGEESGKRKKKDKFNPIGEYLRGDPGKVHSRMRTLARTWSIEKLKAKIERYEWNTPQKKRILVWIRVAYRLYKKFSRDDCKQRWNEYCSYDHFGGEYSRPNQHYGFLWSDCETAVCEEYNQYLNNQLNESEIIGFRRITDLQHAKALEWNDEWPELMQRFMVFACFCFGDDFMKIYNKRGRHVSRLINVLDDDEDENEFNYDPADDYDRYY